MAVLPQSVFFPNTTTYTSIEQSYFSATAVLAPSCFVQPTTTEEVQSFITTITQPGLTCDFAIKSGGHSPSVGASDIHSPGITLDLKNLNTVSVSQDHSVVSVGTGATWFDVYKVLDPLGRTAAGGRNGGVGVGGLTLGGGISYFSPQVGWTCDTVVNFEVVLSSGEVINASATSNPSLFRALKGGTNNLGIVTSISFRTLLLPPAGQILGGTFSNSFSDAEKLYKAFANITNAKTYDVHASIVMSFSFNTTSKVWTTSTTPIYTDPKVVVVNGTKTAETPEAYKELFAIPNTDNTIQLRNISTFSNEAPIPQLYAIPFFHLCNNLRLTRSIRFFEFITGTYSPTASLLSALVTAANSTLFGFDVPGGSSWGVSFEPLPTAFVAPGAGRNVLGTSPLDGNSMIVLGGPIWFVDSLNTTTQMREMSKKVLEAMNNVARSMGGLKKFQYANYADTGQEVVGSYGSGNVEFLKKVSAEYDPKSVFQERVPGGFKL